MHASTIDLLADDGQLADDRPRQSTSPVSSAKPFAPLTKSHAIVFDIETGPLPPEQLWQVVEPFDPSSIQPFDPASVAVGNLKDPAKIAEKIEAAREKHAAASATAKPDYERAILEKAALDPTTGRVLAIGFIFSKEDDSSLQFSDGTLDGERNLLAEFWDYAGSTNENNKLVGHNIHGFDLPFLYRRSLLLDVKVPTGMLEQHRYWPLWFVDTMRVWACGGTGMVGLDRLARAFGIGKKSGDGKDFARLWEEDRDAAQEYLNADLGLTYEVARRLGVCQ